jgi:hypothetical protein
MENAKSDRQPVAVPDSVILDSALLAPGEDRSYKRLGVARGEMEPASEHLRHPSGAVPSHIPNGGLKFPIRNNMYVS